jgi:hypothetical protein
MAIGITTKPALTRDYEYTPQKRGKAGRDVKTGQTKRDFDRGSDRATGPSCVGGCASAGRETMNALAGVGPVSGPRRYSRRLEHSHQLKHSDGADGEYGSDEAYLDPCHRPRRAAAS